MMTRHTPAQAAAAVAQQAAMIEAMRAEGRLRALAFRLAMIQRTTEPPNLCQ